MIKAQKKAVGLLMLALGLAILTGYDKRLEGFFLVNCKLIDNPNLKHTQLIL